MNVRPVLSMSVRAATLALALLGGGLAAAEPPAAQAPPDSRGLFEPIRSVIQHPRCLNCHVADGRPRQYDDSRMHNQNVQGGPDGRGMPGLPCSTCHQSANAPTTAGPHAPPGAPNWHLAPKEMVWVDVSARVACVRLRDPRSNGGKDLAQLLHHFADDKLVAWGWQPGGGRSTPPLTHAQTVAAVKAWIDAGAPCPAG